MKYRPRNDEIDLLLLNFTDAFRKGLREAFTEYDLRASCISCKNFDHANEVCKKFNARPPAHVIAFACESYEDNDEIPF